MKTTPHFLAAAVIICQFAICNLQLQAQSVGINAIGIAPDPSALLDVNAAPTNNKGLLLPRLSTVERNAIVSPAQSLLIYNTTDSCYQGYIGTQWVSFGCVGSGCTTPPTLSAAGVDQALACGVNVANLAGNTPTVGTGLWTVVSGIATITTPTSPTSGVTGLTVPGTVTLRWTISNPPCTPSTDDVLITTSSCVVNCTTTSVIPITNPITGRTWMDRNLGASQVATSITDTAAYGCLYQWGRGADGHESRTSGTTPTLSSTNTPGHANFITSSILPNDWRNPQNGGLWQGVGGINNPCPAGYRLPTDLELDAERASWTTSDAAGAFGSPLKLPMPGFRDTNGGVSGEGILGWYWSSAINGTNAWYLHIVSASAFMNIQFRGRGYSIRCIQN